MTTGIIPAPLGQLSNDIILICDRDAVVREANPYAVRTLGAAITGKPLLQILTTMSQAKGAAFIEHLRHLVPGACSDGWELRFDVAQATPLLITVRGAALERGGWLLVGGNDASRLTAFYHEVLAINNELTNLIRQLSKDQARLKGRIEELLQPQEHDSHE
jgi:hypothetical protein